MKKQKHLFIWILGAILLLLSFNSWAQSPTSTVRLMNVTQVSCNVYEFDVYLQRTGANVFRLCNFQLGILVNPAMIPAGGVVTVSPATPTGSGLIAVQQPPIENYGYDAVKNCILVTPLTPAPPPIVNGTNTTLILNTNPGTKLTRVRVACSQAFVTGEATNHTWNFSIPVGYPTKLFAFVGATAAITDVTAGATFSAPLNITFSGTGGTPVPQTVTTDVTEYCSNAGNGANISLESTEPGFTYYMYVDGFMIASLGAPNGPKGVIYGNGSGQTFGYLATGSVISVKSTSCTGMVDMSNVINLTPLAPLDADISIAAVAGGFQATPVNGDAVPYVEWYVNGVIDDYSGFGNDLFYPSDALVSGDEVYCLLYTIEACITPATALVQSNTIVYSTAVAPLPFAVTGTGSYCQGAGGLAVGLAGSEVGVTYTLSPGGDVMAGTGAAISFGNKLAGTYTVSGTNAGGTTPMTGSAVITETPSSTVEETASACDSYFWAVSGLTYTTGGDKTFVDGCVTHILHLTITPSSTVEETASACDSYFWAVSGLTYTTGGDKTFVDGCVTHILHLTITPSSTVEETASACDSYFWAVSGLTYTTGGDKTFVDGCVTHILHLTITPSSTVEETASACDSYFWAVSGLTYTTGGDKTFVDGCVTHILHLTITPTVTPTFTQLGPYVQGAVPAALPGSSNNGGITGTWNPATISTAAVGSFTYDFTPTPGQCATTASMTIVVNAPEIPATATWTGAGSANNWNDAANWNTGVPGAITAVTIPGGLSNYPTLAAPATIASLLIADGGSFIGAEFLTTGSASVKRIITNNRPHFMSSPVSSGATFGNVFDKPMTTWVREWNPLTNAWVNKSGGLLWVVGKGYNVQTTTPVVVATYTGPLNKVEVTTSNLSTMNGGWNLLGNPFQSAIDWDDVVIGSGMNGTVSVYDNNTYKTWNAGSGNLPLGIIPAQNGFYVQALSGTNNFVTIPLAARKHSGQGFYKSLITNVLRVDVNGNELEDATFVRFSNQATESFDNFDGEKIFGDASCPQVYSLAPDRRLSINSLPMEGNEIVDLGFKCNATGEYTLNASGMETFDATTPIILEDLMLNTTQNLRSNPVYSFNYVNGDKENRFRLHFKSATGITGINNSGINIYSLEKSVVINNTSSLSGEVWIYDAAGRELVRSSMTSQGKTTIPVNAAIGVYMVKVVTAKGSVAQKVFIR